jgi:DNA-binding NarL/FixJ family response regulator
MAMKRNTVMIVDDHPMFRRGLRRIIEESGRYEIVAEATVGYEAIRLAGIHEPHIIVSDIQLPGISGLKIARILKKQLPKTQIIFCTMHDDDERLFDALRAGAAGFLAKGVDAADLLNAIDRVAKGEQVINLELMARPQLAWRVLAEFRGMAHDGDRPRTPFPLSVREVEVLDCVAQGLSNKEVADALFITEQTVKNHMTNVLRKLGVEDRVQALLYAVRHGWVEIGHDARTGRVAA